MSVEKRTKTVGFRLGKERLLTEEEPMTLSVAMAKDFIVSCMFGAHKNKYMTNEMATEMTARFKAGQSMHCMRYVAEMTA